MEANENKLLSKSIGFWVNGLARLIRLTLENQLKEVGLTPTTWTVLMALGEEDQLSQTGLARRTLLDGATITRALDLLAAKDYIMRNRDDVDRRVQIVELTETGRAMTVETIRFGMAVNDQISGILTEEVYDRFNDILRHLVQELQTAHNNGINSGR